MVLCGRACGYVYVCLLLNAGALSKTYSKYFVSSCFQSLVHVLKSRKTLTEPEVRYFLRHLVNGCKYIHSQKIVHRDLKLGNMLINEAMQVKIADFGLATRMEYEGEKKMWVLYCLLRDDVITCTRFLYYWPFVWGIHR